MALDTFPPEWLDDLKQEMKEILDSKKYQNYEKLIQNFNILNSDLIKLPQITRQVLLKDNTPSFLLIETLFSHFSYTYFYKLRQLILTLNYSFSEGHFVSSAILLRSILEMVCHHWYFLIRQRELINTIHKTALNLKSKKHRTQVLTSVTTELYEIYKLLDRANTGSDFPWNSHLGLNMENTPKKLHVLEAVKDLEKKSKIPIEKYYSLLSEMTHPNYGSHTLVVQTKGNETEDLCELIIGDTKYLESALWFFDNLSDGMLDIVNLALSSIQSTNELGSIYQDLVDRNYTKNRQTLQ